MKAEDLAIIWPEPRQHILNSLHSCDLIAQLVQDPAADRVRLNNNINHLKGVLSNPFFADLITDDERESMLNSISDGEAFLNN